MFAHREELVRQAAEKIEAVTGEEVEIEMADQQADAHMFRRARIVVASKDTLIAPWRGGRRMDKFNPDDFGLVIPDEAHHATATSYRAVFDYFKRAKVFGVTATPDRSDREALNQVFESVAFRYDVIDAVRDAWLVPIIARPVILHGLDYSQVRSTAGDLNGADLAKVMNHEEILQQIADVSLKEAKWRKAILFAPPGFKRDGDESFRVSERIVEIFNRKREGSARLVWQGTHPDERRQTLRDFKSTRLQFLVNVGVFTEGFDEPTIDMVILARPTKSRALYSQMLGRGTRALPGVVDGLATAQERKVAIAASRKPNLEVIDFEGNCGRHRIVSALDILGGKISDKARELAMRQIREAGRAMSIDEAVANAHAEMAKREEAQRVAAEKRRRVVGSADYEMREVNVLDQKYHAPERMRQYDRSIPPTDAQLRYLRYIGVPTANLTRGQASAIIGKHKAKGNVISSWSREG